MSDAALKFRDLGLVEYRECLELMRALHADVARGATDSTVLFVEHPRVLTLGRHADPKHLLMPAHVPVVAVERGGEVTAHEPGQLVCYPVLLLAAFKLMPKRLVEKLESAVIATLASFGIEASTDSVHPGVWVGREKICAVGLRVQERASFHGIALNVDNDLELFSLITPCGIAGRSVTSMSRLLGKRVPIEGVKARLKAEIAQRIEIPVARADVDAAVPDGRR